MSMFYFKMANNSQYIQSYNLAQMSLPFISTANISLLNNINLPLPKLMESPAQAKIQPKMSSIYLDDTIDTIKFQKDALQIKFKHNINELAAKNVQLSSMLKDLVIKEQTDIVTECDTFKKMVDSCISIQDSLVSLEALEKKTQILKQQVLLIKEHFATEPIKINQKLLNQMDGEKKRLRTTSEDEHQIESMQHAKKKTKMNVQQKQCIKIYETFSQNIKDAFEPSQIKNIIKHLLKLQDYSKIVSIEVQHHQKSIATLPKRIIDQFPELQSRVQEMINRAIINTQFIHKILEPYRPLIYQQLQEEKQAETIKNKHEHSHSHSHSHGHQNYTAIMAMFHQVVREWSEQEDIQHIKKIIGYVDKHFNFGQEGQNGQTTKLLVVGCGMGRILTELHASSGHESQTQTYLCAQYFLKRSPSPMPVYPYIHNFCNFKQQSDPYRCLMIPFKQLQQSQSHLTLGDFPKLYHSHRQNWSIIITTYNSYHITDILQHIKLIYSILKQDGLWIDLSTSNFDCNVIKMTYRQYEQILDTSQFKLLESGRTDDYWFGDGQCLMNQRRVSHYRVMRK